MADFDKYDQNSEIPDNCNSVEDFSGFCSEKIDNECIESFPINTTTTLTTILTTIVTHNAYHTSTLSNKLDFNDYYMIHTIIIWCTIASQRLF